MFVRASHMAHTTPWRSAFDLRLESDMMCTAHSAETPVMKAIIS